VKWSVLAFRHGGLLFVRGAHVDGANQVLGWRPANTRPIAGKEGLHDKIPCERCQSRAWL